MFAPREAQTESTQYGISPFSMKTRALATALLLAGTATARGQQLAAIADSIRARYHIPELGYAVISADSIIEMRTLGYRRHGSTLVARPEDRFHLGSNTKGVTGFIAALLVKRGAIRWETKFFDLYPTLKSRSNRAYYRITLLELLTHRAGVPGLLIGDRFPDQGRFHGSIAEQRLQFGTWVLAQPPADMRRGYSFSNAGFILAALMLERASGATWEELVADAGAAINVHFAWSYPNENDSLQPWGHDRLLRPIPPQHHDKETLLSAAGNLNVSVADYAEFIRVQLLGLAGRSPLLTQRESEFLHFGAPIYAVGWEWSRDTNGDRVNDHSGSAGMFRSRAIIHERGGRAYVVLTNSATDQTAEGIEALMRVMERMYGD